MQDEKSGVDNMMQNIIEQGLKNKDKTQCIFSDLIDEKTGNKIDDAKSKIDEKITNGCAYILSD